MLAVKKPLQTRKPFFSQFLRIQQISNEISLLCNWVPVCKRAFSAKPKVLRERRSIQENVNVTFEILVEKHDDVTCLRLQLD
jgi:hypothetical protein